MGESIFDNPTGAKVILGFAFRSDAQDTRLTDASEPVGTLDVALRHAARLLEKDPGLAAEQATEILRAVPGHPQARLILGAAHRIAGRTQLALDILEPLAGEQSRSV